jgi:hypothetical protein
MIIGTNWLLGWSHRSPAADSFIKSFHSSKEAMFPLLSKFTEYGVDTVMGPISGQPLMLEAIRHAEEKTGRQNTEFLKSSGVRARIPTRRFSPVSDAQDACKSSKDSGQ